MTAGRLASWLLAAFGAGALAGSFVMLVKARALLCEVKQLLDQAEGRRS